MNNPDWKVKVQDALLHLQDEVKKTTQVGMKMISASKTSSCLNKAYEDLGMLVCKAIDDGSLTWESQKAQDLLKTIEKCKEELHDIEQDVKNIKSSTEEPTEKSK